jgi:hypothetical protein
LIMPPTRFLARLRVRRMQRRMRERIALVVILGLFMLCCCLSFWLGMVNYTLRDVLGILPRMCNPRSKWRRRSLLQITGLFCPVIPL